MLAQTINPEPRMTVAKNRPARGLFALAAEAVAGASFRWIILTDLDITTTDLNPELLKNNLLTIFEMEG